MYTLVFAGPGWAIRSPTCWEWYDARGMRLVIVETHLRTRPAMYLTYAGEQQLTAREAALMCLAPPRGKTLAELW